MEEMRQSTRFPIQMQARYLEKSNNAWYDFSTVNISRAGMAIELFPKEKFNRDSPFQSELILPSKKEPILITGDVMWTKEVNGNGGSHIIGGIRFTRIDESSKRNLLDYAFNDWYSQQTKLEVGYQYKFMGVLLIVINIVIWSVLIYTLLTKYK
jgi:c-di-GMP-binding flagellar brake protein YcgR